jgi:hypothetical protein
VFAVDNSSVRIPKAGDEYDFGDYTWQVLDVQDSKALIITKDIIDLRAINEENVDISNPDTAYLSEYVTWENCTLRAWLNKEFYEGFNVQERERILETLNKNNDNPWYGTDGGNDTKDKIFLLSIEEVVEYFGDSGKPWEGDGDEAGDLSDPYYMSTRQAKISKKINDDYLFAIENKMGMRSGEIRETEAEHGGFFWWLRSPGVEYPLFLNVTLYSGIGFAGGGVGGVLGYFPGGVRPVMWVNIKASDVGNTSDDQAIEQLRSPETASGALVAAPTSSTVIVNGRRVAFDAYNIGGNNYFKLRDLAYTLNGTEKQFEVGWDSAANAITLTAGAAYTPVGGEMASKGAGDKSATSTSSKLHLDGAEAGFTAYNIGGNNYFKLRDIGQAFNFGVDWDGANQTIVIDTGKGYTP